LLQNLLMSYLVITLNGYLIFSRDLFEGILLFKMNS
jgi:hypothetical protein